MTILRWFVVLGVWLGVGVAVDGQQEEEARLVFPVNGFSIAPLEAPTPGASCAPLAMSLPSMGGLAANVNVRIQSYPGSMAEYISLTKSQFQQHGLTVIKIEMQGEFAARLEYTGTMRSMSLHWYARAIKRGNQVYLVTGTALDAQWSAVETLLRRCVDSFRLD